MKKAISSNPTRSLKVIDPRTLGRPVHLLGEFGARLREDLEEVFVGGLNRRYRAAFMVGEVQVSPAERAGEQAASQRWLGFVAPQGRVGFSLDRRLLLSVLHYRYGLNGGLGKSDEIDNSPETASEGRLAAMLGLQLVNTLGARIEAEDGAGQPCEFQPGTAPLLGRGTWVVEVQISEAHHEVQGSLRFSLDEAWMARLLRKLAPAREKTRDTAQALPLAPRLPITLVARLVERQLSLGELLDVKIGDVIPVTIGPADVLVDGACLMHAAVAEHKGKLCLTSFEDTE